MAVAQDQGPFNPKPNRFRRPEASGGSLSEEALEPR